MPRKTKSEKSQAKLASNEMATTAATKAPTMSKETGGMKESAKPIGNDVNQTHFLENYSATASTTEAPADDVKESTKPVQDTAKQTRPLDVFDNLPSATATGASETIKELGTLRERILGNNPLSQINSGGIGANKSLSSLPPDTFDPSSDRFKFEKQYGPDGRKSLAGIAIRSNLTGFVFAASLCSVYYLVALSPNPTPLWRIPFFLALLANFHFLEFYTMASANTPEAQISTFLLTSNGLPYAVAHGSATLECLITNLYFPNRHWLPNFVSYTLVFLGIMLVVMGQGIRSLAIFQAGRSFTHIVQTKKRPEHVLITHGIYAYLRHPSYFGFYWWGLGSQLVLGNPISFVLYAIVLHRFFESRIKGEEKKLVDEFFGDDYIQYREKTPIGIPFIK